MEWKKFRLHTTTAAEDLVSSELMELGIDGIEIEDHVPLSEAEKKQMYVDILPDPIADDGKAVITFYLDSDEDIDGKLAAVKERLAALSAFTDVGGCEMEASVTKDEDWVNNWKAFFKPFRVDEEILIKPTWESCPEVGEHDLVIEMDPGTAFGTGSHETTKLCILALKPFMNPSIRLLDVGCGSGILSIIGMKLGAGEATAIDIDPSAVSAAEENAAVNGVDLSRYHILAGNILDDPSLKETVGTGYDVVAANILADVIIPLSGLIGEYMRPGGIFISSGIIDMKEAEVREALLANGFEIMEVNHMGDWVSFTARKPE
ncbi:50S ribosomal protein L11 methyltransferase [Anaerolentibacter hominis]|uniref:50S ribosomal protein L11 methyltransferase n=1 Tax=Anaerolentibacter hominis TaxID=3079009 RepID=UPI0031B88179